MRSMLQLGVPPLLTHHRTTQRRLRAGLRRWSARSPREARGDEVLVQLRREALGSGVLETAGSEGGRPLAILVKILKLPFTRNETGAYAWPTAYRAHPTRADWDALVRVGVLTRKAADAMRKGGNVYYWYRTAITKSGRWRFFIAGD
jgi:hypothetical protein